MAGVKRSVVVAGALFFLAVLHSTLFPCFATDHIVGANRGWQPPANAGPDAHLNYTVWAASQKFYLGDLVSFHYPENMQYSVFQVNFSVYTNCTISMWSGHDWIYNWTNKGGRTVIPLNKTMVYYFVDASHCNEGMKVAVNVTKNVTEGTSLSKESKGQSDKSSAPMYTYTLSLLIVVQAILFVCVQMLYPGL
ncbi:hypothetical protein KP509_25G003500 [Ceratopteris richardii]|uniref:Phytocyanin domain-containing protein n=1 Tax=Ceratopteris richardii TaxID=49495 RepID=A0A8T2RQ90_CERRI|nr:hypothetical protein KP509_25G003500 [Ceratopteris richardii]